jgi:hypothetical protein
VALGIHADGVRRALRQPPRVRLVVDRELARVAEAVGLRPQHARAGRVEGHQPHPPRGPAEQQLDALAHLPGRLVRERDRQDLPRLRLICVDQEGDPMREHAGLAAARPREDQQRPLAVRNSLPLRLVETVQQLLQVLGMGVFGHQSQHRCVFGGPLAGIRESPPPDSTYGRGRPAATLYHM